MNQPPPGSSRAWPFAILGAVILVLYFAKDVLIPFSLALTLTFLLTPAVIWLEKMRLGRIGSVMIVLLITVGAAGGIGWVVANQLLDVANELPKYRPNIRNKLNALHSPAGSAVGRAMDSIKEIAQEFSDLQVSGPASGQKPPRRGTAPLPSSPPAAPLPVKVIEAPNTALQDVREFFVPLLKPAGMAGIVLIFTVFMLIKREDLRNRLLRLVGLGQLNVMTQALDDAAQRISRYLLLQIAVNAGFGALFGLGLFLIGIPNATLWGVIAGMLRIVPYVGSVIAAALPLLLAFAFFNSWIQPLLVFLLFAFLELITANFVEPWLYGAHTGISSLALLVTTVFWTVLWGWAGLVLSTPLTVCVIVLGRYVPQMSFLHVLLGDEPVLAPDALFYQRLLAMDQNEARAVVELYLKDHTLVELYDLVLIPALSLAEQDRHKGALDLPRESFLFLSTNELIAELAEYRPELEGADPSTPARAPISHQARPSPARILCVPANDQADEMAGAMLGQLLEQSSYPVLSLPLGSHIEDLLEMFAPEASDIICISALPPFAFAHARSLCKRVRAVSSHARIIVGLWGYPGDTEKARQRFGSAQPERLLTTLAEALVQTQEWENAAASEAAESGDPVNVPG